MTYQSRAKKMNITDFPKSFIMSIKKIIMKEYENEVAMTPLPRAGTDPNLFIRDSSAHKFKTFVLYYLNSRAEVGEREGKLRWNLPSELGYPNDLHKETFTKHSSCSNLCFPDQHCVECNCCGFWHLSRSIKIANEVTSFCLGLQFFDSFSIKLLLTLLLREGCILCFCLFSAWLESLDCLEESCWGIVLWPS